MHSHTALPATAVAPTLVKWTLRRLKTRTSLEAYLPSRSRSQTGACPLKKGVEVEAWGPSCYDSVRFRTASLPYTLSPPLRPLLSCCRHGRRRRLPRSLLLPPPRTSLPYECAHDNDQRNPDLRYIHVWGFRLQHQHAFAAALHPAKDSGEVRSRHGRARTIELLDLVPRVSS